MNLTFKQKLTQAGFTLVELITVMVILGVLAATAMPRFFNSNTFTSRGFFDQTISTLHYAQKTAIAQRRFVCVAFTVNSITLTLDPTAPSTAHTAATCPGINMVDFNGQPSFIVNAPNGVSLSGFNNFNFDALGRASAAQSITVSGYNSPLTVVAETGYAQ